MIPTPRLLKSRIILNSSAISALLSAAVGSSMMSTRELWENDLAISTICCLATVRSPTTVRGSKAQVEMGEQFGRLAVELVLVEQQAEGPLRLATDEDVLRDGEVIHQLQFLMNDADPGVLRFARTGEIDARAVVKDLAAESLV